MCMILGVESSCDDTGLAVFDGERFVYEKTSSQIDLHARYGGVVPQLAAREHLRNFPVLFQDLKESIGINFDRIAVTCGPGLPGSLALGLAFAQSVGIATGRPVVGVNHLRGHILSSFIGRDFDENVFPHLSLLVSGGNTLLLRIDSNWDIKIIAQTIDDAAGEALDKGAKLLGLRYPGGPEIEQYASQGDKKAFKFPQAFREKESMKFSFSGLKTSLRYLLEKMSDAELDAQFCNLCASYQFAVVDVLLHKLQQVLFLENFKSIGVCGGVSNNFCLREGIRQLSEDFRIPFYMPDKKYTGDNASMIAFAAEKDPQHTVDEIDFRPNWPL